MHHHGVTFLYFASYNIQVNTLNIPNLTGFHVNNAHKGFLVIQPFPNHREASIVI